jgi:uncharacterized membrane protein YfcA
MIELLTLLGIGLVVGFAGGTLGIGGGFLLVPILFSWLSWPMIAAVATSHFCGLAVSASATRNYSNAGLIDWRLGIVMEVAAVAGSALGAWGARWISVDIVAVGFAIVAILSAYRMWKVRRDDSVAGGMPMSKPSARQYWIALPAMLVVGALSGILGLGGGVFIVPILTEIMHLPIRRAVGTSVFMVGMNAAAAGVVYYLHGDVPAQPASLLAGGVFLGALIGSAVQHRLPALLLRRAFAIIMAVLSIRLLIRALG